jgi:hypothetical protein
MLKKIFVITLLITCCIPLSGCLNQSNDPAQMIVGKWKRVNFIMEQTWEFKSNGTLDISKLNQTVDYWFANNSLNIFYNDLEFLDIYTYKFNGKDELVLTLQGGHDIIIDPTTGKPKNLPLTIVTLQRLNGY